MKIGCAVLAGGKSSRMGTDKALLQLDGKNFIKRLCDELDCFEEKIIARGSRSDLKDISWKIIPDIYPERGPIGGLHAVLSVCQSDAVFCVSCDMPLLQSSLVKELCEYFERRTNNPSPQMRGAYVDAFRGCLCQLETQSLPLTSCEAACVHEQAAKADCECPLSSASAELSERCIVSARQTVSAYPCHLSETLSGKEIDAMIAVTENGRKHPLCGIYRKSVLPILEEQILTGNYRMMAALDRMRVEYVPIDLQSSHQLKNINTPQEYRGVLSE